MFNSLSKREKKKLITAILCIAVILFCVVFELYENNKRRSLIGDEYAAVHFIDAGQGDCTLIETSDGKFAIIDASTQDASDKITDYLKDRNVKEIEFILFTHPHEDHIGCGDEIINEFKVKTVYMNKVTQNTSAYENVINAIKKSKGKYGTKLLNPREGDTISLSDLEFTILSDGSGYGDNINNSSICVKLEYGKSSFLFTGDAEKEVEEDLLESDFNVEADVYHCGHHGSSTSNSEDFLDEVSPDISVISCGTDNSYGHPHTEVIKALNKMDVDIYQTNKDGDIVIVFDKKSISVK
ncbi:MAG: MBL fold metallo-hydrolase [Ruminococcaceae bacterium]|nr:MBL fold metallo-hydrolase [Oscillospiraceae bacterium]